MTLEWVSRQGLRRPALLVFVWRLLQFWGLWVAWVSSVWAHKSSLSPFDLFSSFSFHSSFERCSSGSEIFLFFNGRVLLSSFKIQG